MQVQSGTGNSQWMEVDSYHRAKTFATKITEFADVSRREEEGYSVSTDALTFNSTNEHPFLFMRNDNTDLLLFFSSIIYSYNGGDTNHNRTMIKRVYHNPPLPTDNYTELDPPNANFSTFRNAQMLSYIWDGSSTDGMEVDLSNIPNLSTSIVPQGSLTLTDLEGIVLGYKSSILFTFQPEEIGKASVSTKIYFNQNHCS